ncbi:GroES-like protein [Apiospora kogelbergensis]|uniref:GroES-like protein n=1 Tax=Apiospora kogelbergensis TaxID=1337665 RepID=A0AAW0QD98_9PEZI
MATHLAAIVPVKGQPLELQTRATPKPGPGELLLLVKSVALNPADGLMREHGLFTPKFPTVIGFDVAGLVLEVGDGVLTCPVDDRDAPSGLFFVPGVTRVAAHSERYWRSCNPDYGVFQERCLVPWQHAVPLPDGDNQLSWNQAATLPVAVVVAMNAWGTMGFRVPTPTSTPTTTSAEKKKREALLIWGASSSVGTMGVQTAQLIQEDLESPVAAVYATSGPANQTYVGSLGADRVFDYNDPRVVEAIVSAAREDGLVVRHCFLAMGQIALCQAVVKAFLKDNNDEEGHVEKRTESVIGSAPPLPADMGVVDGVETVFLIPSTEEKVRLEQFQFWMGTWLRRSLVKGSVRPSPEPRVVGKGLGTINAGLNMVLQGVSCAKLVVEIGS